MLKLKRLTNILNSLEYKIMTVSTLPMINLIYRQKNNKHNAECKLFSILNKKNKK